MAASNYMIGTSWGTMVTLDTLGLKDPKCDYILYSGEVPLDDDTVRGTGTPMGTHCRGGSDTPPPAVMEGAAAAAVGLTAAAAAPRRAPPRGGKGRLQGKNEAATGGALSVEGQRCAQRRSTRRGAAAPSPSCSPAWEAEAAGRAAPSVACS